MRERSLYPRMAATLLAVLGLFDAAYLTISHYRGGLVCPIGGGCETVQTSQWSTLPPGNGIPVAVLGVVGYALLFGLALVALQRDRIGSIALPPTLLLVASAGLALSIYFTVLQLFVIQAICFWCVGSALIELGIWIAALLDWQAWRRVDQPVVRSTRHWQQQG